MDLTNKELLVLAIENVLVIKPSQSTVGDIFITTQGFYFIPYATYQSIGNAGKVLSGAIGGITGGLATTVGNNEQSQLALGNAIMSREKDYGLSIRERFAIHNLEDRRLISIEDIHHLTYDRKTNSLYCSTKSGKSNNYTIQVLTSRQVETISRYSSEYKNEIDLEKSAYYGLNLPYPAPKRIIEMIIQPGNDNLTELLSISKEMANQVEINRYANTFFALLMSQKGALRLEICNTLNSKSPQFASMIATAAFRKSRYFTWSNMIFILGAVGFLVLGIAIVIQSIHDSNITNAIGNGILFGIVSLAFSIVPLFLIRGPRNVLFALTGGRKGIQPQ